jgi:hypothetical protein
MAIPAISGRIGKFLGWCPDARSREARAICNEHDPTPLGIPVPDAPHAGSPAATIDLPRGVVIGLIVGCMVWLGLTGFPWWAFFVLSILIAGLAFGCCRWHSHKMRGAD